MGVSGQGHAPAALSPRGKDPRFPLDRRLEEESFASAGDRTPVDQSSHTLYWLSFCISYGRETMPTNMWVQLDGSSPMFLIEHTL
jgi:hypothetical protein